jgi:hypothetical protein
MKFRFLILFLMVIFTTKVIAQEEETEEKKGFDKSKLFIGGNFGASFGDYTLINISPQLGYRFSNFFAAGAGLNFIYSSLKSRDYNNNPDYKATYGVTGLNIFGRIYPIRQILLQVQPEMNYTWGKYKFYDGQPDYKLAKEFVPSLLLGGGAAIPTGNGALMMLLQYDVIQRERSPYGTKPFFSIGYTIGL